MTESEERGQKTDLLLAQSEALRTQLLGLADELDQFVAELRCEVTKGEPG